MLSAFLFSGLLSSTCNTFSFGDVIAKVSNLYRVSTDGLLPLHIFAMTIAGFEPHFGAVQTWPNAKKSMKQ